jgi:predicted O-methyltransferase YrrM
MLGQLGMNVGVEVGTRFGDFAKVLCEANKQLALTCVDPWLAYNNRTQEWQDASYAKAMHLLGPYNIDVMRLTSMDAVRHFQPNSIDFVFIDGNHDFEFAIMDIIHWSKIVRPGGIVLVHDYHPYCGSDVPIAVRAWTEAMHIDPWYVTRELEPTAFWVKQ